MLGDLAKSLRDDDDRLPLRLVLAEALALARGPWRLLRSRLSRRRIPPLVLPDADPDARPRLAVLGADAPALSVAVASYNRREQLREVLVALGEQSYPSERYEVVLVVDGSTDGSAEMARSLELPYRLRVVEQENRGLAATRNRGAHEAAHPVVVFLDDDIVPEPAFLAEHARAHQSSPDDHVALGAYPAVVTDPSLWGFCVRAWWSDHFRRKAHPQHQWTFADFCDGNASLPRQLLLAAGGYDEEFRGGCRQDWELAIRLLERGVRFEYQPSARGRH